MTDQVSSEHEGSKSASMDNDYEAVHDLGVQICHKCSLLATHFCKTCQDNLCKVCIIKYYQNTNFKNNHDMLPI